MNVSTTVDVDLVTGAGTIDVEGTAGAVTMNDTATAQAGTGDVRLVAGTDAAIGSLQTDANVSVIAGSAIIDGGETNIDVAAAGLRMRAGTAIATNADAIETTVATLTARAEAGGIFLLESDGVTVDDVTVTVQRVADASLTATVDAIQSDLKTNGADGDVVLESTTGDVTLNDGTAADDDAGDAVNANGAGDVLIRALDGSITANADVRSTDGNLSILASMDV